MKKLGKKLKASRETIAAYACYCNCNQGCTCNCPVYYASYSISNGMYNVPNAYKSNAISNVNSY